MTHPMPQCVRRPFCGRAPVCATCFSTGHALSTAKLLHGCGQTHIDSLPGLIATAWPTATPIEIRAVAHALLHGNKTANLRPTVAKASDTTVWHRLHQVLDIVYKLVPSVANIQPFLVANRIKPSDVSPEALKLHKLHVIERTPTKLVARQATELNATNSATLLDALKKRGVAGVPLSTVYAEYEGAYEHVHKYPPAVAHRSLTHVWHAQVAPPPAPGALTRWRACRANKAAGPTLPRHADNKYAKIKGASGAARQHAARGGLVHRPKPSSRQGTRLSAMHRRMKSKRRVNRSTAGRGVKLNI